MLSAMNARERLHGYLLDELESLQRQIDLFSSGRAQFREAVEGKMMDTTEAAVADMRQRRERLLKVLEEFSGA